MPTTETRPSPELALAADRVAKFYKLVIALMNGDRNAAAEARRDLERLGVAVHLRRNCGGRRSSSGEVR